MSLKSKVNGITKVTKKSGNTILPEARPIAGALKKSSRQTIAHGELNEKNTFALGIDPSGSGVNLNIPKDPKLEIVLDIGQFVLDLTGIIEPTPFSDGTNALISLSRGRWTDFVISAASAALPYAGDLAKTAKLPKYARTITKAVDIAKADAAWAAALKKTLTPVKKNLDDLLEIATDKLPEAALSRLKQIKREIDSFLSGPAGGTKKVSQSGSGAGGSTPTPAPEPPAKLGTNELTPGKSSDSLNEISYVPKNLPTPKVTNPKLKNLVDDLYKGSKGPDTIGIGSTADAVRNELKTGLPTHGRFHSQKAQEYSNALNKWIKKNPNASDYDKMTARSLLNDLQSALGGN